MAVLQMQFKTITVDNGSEFADAKAMYLCPEEGP